MGGDYSSARPPGEIKPGKLWKVFSDMYLVLPTWVFSSMSRGVRSGQHNREGGGCLTFLFYNFTNFSFVLDASRDTVAWSCAKK